MDYVAAAALSPGSKLTTPTAFGLVNPTPGNYDAAPPPAAAQDIDTSKTPWQRFESYVHGLNKSGPASVRYKIVFLTRHGIGYHNLMEAKVGTEAWDNHWSRLPGDGVLMWEDARLTSQGTAQAKALGQIWLSASASIVVPQSLYSSPLARCLETCRLSLSPLFAHLDRPFHPAVHELLRERLWDHYCDKRSTRSWIESHYPEFRIEERLSECDELWNSESIESIEEHSARKGKALSRIWEEDSAEVISLTIHSGAIAAILNVCGAEDFKVAEGTCFAVLIRGERQEVLNFLGSF